MKFIKILILSLAAFIIVQCSTPKKTTAPAPTASATTAPAPTPMVMSPFVANPGYDVPVPGNDELTAIQAKYPEATMQVLNEGHALYTGICIDCHNATPISYIPADHWPGLLDNMALKAKISDAQKDAVNKYVLAVMAAQAKGTK